ncbi:phage tail tape measure protein [Tardiphaga sp. 11_C7_N12_6]|uniref:phage tail tape measure protein n=1 Tax=Tardiphaga sp. 11_C7_N12_6 TaxID=3240789 RepID=UPI003F244C2B
MAQAFSVYVNIGGKLDKSLAGAVSAAKSTVNGLGASLGSIGARINAPFLAAQKQIDATSKRLEKLTNKGRDLSLAVSLPTAMAGKSGYDIVYGFEKELNKIQAYGELSDVERKRIEDNAREMARLGLAGAKDAVELQRRYVQAGRTVDQAIGMSKPTLNFSLFGDVEPAKAADVITTIAAAYQMPMEKLEQANQVATRIGDVLAKGANISRADVSDFAEGFKYVAPLAHKAGTSVEQVAAAIATMNQHGLKGNEAGVALRSMLVRMVKPTQGARAAMEQAGLSFEQFVNKWSAFDGNGLQGVLNMSGINVKKPLMDKVTAAVKDMDPQTQAAEIRKKVTSMLVDGMDLKARDGKVVAKVISNFLGNMAEEVDADGMIRALEAANVPLGKIASLFDVRQGARLSTLFNGDLYQRMLEQINDKSTDGASKRGAETMLKGLIGASMRLKGAWDNLWISIARSGVLDTVTNMLTKITNALNAIGKSNPAGLRFLTEAAIGAALLGPALFLIGTAGRAAAGALTLMNAAVMIGLAPVRLLATGIVAVGTASVAMAARVRLATVALSMLAFAGGGRAALAAVGASIAALGLSVLKFPIVALRAIGAALIFNPVGLVITGLVTALTALGAWVNNNWEGIRNFFSGFGQGFMVGLGPAAEGVRKMSDGLGSVVKWLGDLIGPLNASNEKWEEWGASVGNSVGKGVTAIIDGIKRVIAVIGEGISAAGRFAGAVSNMWSAPKTLPNAPKPAVPAGARALGGPVSLGKSYLVGERGPELFTPGATGRVDTNGALRTLTENGTAVAAQSSVSSSRTQSAQINVRVEGGGNAQDIAAETERTVYRVFAKLESDQRGLLSD